MFSRFLQEKGSVTGEINHHKKALTETVLKYLTRRQGLELGQRLENKFKKSVIIGNMS